MVVKIYICKRTAVHFLILQSSIGEMQKTQLRKQFMALPLYTIERAGRVTHEMHSPMTEYFVKTASSTVLEEKVVLASVHPPVCNISCVQN